MRKLAFWTALVAISLIVVTSLAQSPGTNQYPTSLDTSVTLPVAADGKVTYLTASATNSATTLTVNSTTGFPSSGVLQSPSGELIAYSGTTATTFTGATRGFSGSTAQAYNANTVVKLMLSAAYVNGTRGAVIALESKLGIDGSGGTGTPTTAGDLLTVTASGATKWLPPATSGTVTSVTASSPLHSSGGTTPNLTIDDAAADSSTKGAASFTAADFNASSGIISIDYTNGQAASGSLKGFLTSGDWTTFNNKVGTARAINTTSPITGGGDLSADRTIACSTCVVASSPGAGIAHFAGSTQTVTSSSIVNADVNAAAAIAYSKLSLSNSIVNADVNSSAAIAYSKLNLSASIVNADIASGAAIANSKLANSTISGISLGSNLSTLTLGIGLTGTSYNGSAGVTATVDQSLTPTWTGQHTFKFSDAITNTFTDVITMGHNSSGTAASSFGGSLIFNLQSSTTVDRNAGRFGVAWSTATDASRTSNFVWQLVNNAGSLTEAARLTPAAFNLASGSVYQINGSQITCSNLSGASSFCNGTDAANLTGSVSDSRLSANVPLLNAANSFTNDITIYANPPTLKLQRNSGTTTYLGTFGFYSSNGTKGWALEENFTLGNDILEINKGSTNYAAFRADGGFTVGAPTGGSCGSGCINVATDVKKNNTAYTNPDYVFERWATGRIERFANSPGAREYQGTMAIGDLERYVRTNYHLPGFGPEAHHGLFSGSDALLQSVEENYLYDFQQQKAIEELKSRGGSNSHSTVIALGLFGALMAVLNLVQLLRRRS